MAYEWSMSLSVIIAFNLIISLTPLIMALLAMFLLIFSNYPSVIHSFKVRLNESVSDPVTAEAIIATIRSLSKQAAAAFVLNFILAIFTTSRFIARLDDALTIIYHLPQRTTPKQLFHAFKLFLVFMIALPLLIVVSNIAIFSNSLHVFFQVLGWFSSVILAFLLLLFLYYFVPSRKMTLKNIWPGALFSSVLIGLLLWLLPLYISNSVKNSLTQWTLLLAIVMTFLFFGLLFVLGAQINAFFFEKIPPLPAGLATCLSRLANPEQIKLLDDDENHEQHRKLMYGDDP